MTPAARGSAPRGPHPTRPIGGSGGSLPRASRAKAPATESQEPQATGGSGGSLPRASRAQAPATESQEPQAIGGSGGSLPRASREK